MDLQGVSVEELIGTDTHIHAEQVSRLQDKLEAISASAEELLATIETTEQVEEEVPQTIDQKIVDFYGVRKIDDAVEFVTLYPRAESVKIAGDFNNWQPIETEMERVDDGKWCIKMPLTAGRYRYRLVVDGQWQQDPYNEHTEMNPFGEYNSVLEVC